MNAHDDEIKRQFTRQAARFGEEGLTLSSTEYLQWVVGQLHLDPSFVVLDVAAGTGHLGRALAPRVRRVVAVDLTEAMIAEGRREAARTGLGNITFGQGRAEQLPYPDSSFDMVVTRLSLHHFADPRPAVREMARVCKTGSQVGIMDMVSPDDPALGDSCNRIERLRDPSHTRCLTRAELGRVMTDAGLAIVQMVAREIEVDLARWLEMTNTAPAQRWTIRDELTGELQGLGITGMRPYLRGDRLMFIQTWITAVGVT
ncbi:MAG: class I SAM-dependent methyltransferase [Syntrophales bacterium]